LHLFGGKGYKLKTHKKKNLSALIIYGMYLERKSEKEKSFNNI
jgi:hypothetical protein